MLRLLRPPGARALRAPSRTRAPPTGDARATHASHPLAASFWRALLRQAPGALTSVVRVNRCRHPHGLARSARRRARHGVELQRCLTIFYELMAHQLIGPDSDPDRPGSYSRSNHGQLVTARRDCGIERKVDRLGLIATHADRTPNSWCGSNRRCRSPDSRRRTIG